MISTSRLVRGAVLLLVPAAALACGSQATDNPLRALQASGSVSFVCVGADGRGREMRECPDREGPVAERNRILALTTQTLTGEVAVVDVTGRRVIDVQPSVPGYSFLPVGARPVDIVTSPEGEASFVAVAAPGREGIFALPTSCVQEPSDLADWPACALPSRPGKLVIVVDPARADGSVRQSCLSGANEAGPPRAALRESCAADLTRSGTQQPGRRKLVVVLPDQGAVAVLDAQAIVDRDPGSFSPCTVEAWLPLRAEAVSGLSQALPADLASASACLSSQASFAGGGQSRPIDIAVADDTLFVSDAANPLIHQLDATDVCALWEREPLVSRSIAQPERLVTTSKLAVSPLTPSRKRFLYAIDEKDEPASSVMVFDVSPGSTERTPIVRSGSARIPFEAADRISFSSPVQDVMLLNHDAPVTDPRTGIGVWGVKCDPDPAVDPSSPEALYRPSSKLNVGAGPSRLRGTFAFALLANGQVAVIDVEDSDAPCRRPALTEPGESEDFRGCSGDVGLPSLLTEDGTPSSPPTVTDEASCLVVAPHRVRSGAVVLTRSDVGVGSPGLRQFPSLSRFGNRLATNQSEQGLRSPKLLPVDFSVGSASKRTARLFVGTTLYLNDPLLTNYLDPDPRTAQRNGLVLPLVEPRAYVQGEDVSLVFEGALAPERLAAGWGAAGTLRDETARFCSQGVQDLALTSELGLERFGLAAAALSGFAERHADYVQITEELLPAAHPYWASAEGQLCGGAQACRDLFGASTTADLESARDFRIRQALHDELVLEPREAGAPASLLDSARCCFPGAFRYRVRAGNQWVLAGSASGLRGRVTPSLRADGRLQCVFDCDPHKALFESRAFELASTACGGGAAERCPVGAAQAGDVCTFDHNLGPVAPDSPCVFSGLTARFAVYRGTRPSQRDMVFSWRTVGGFSPMLLSYGGLEAQSGRVLPVSLGFLPGTAQLAIVDGGTLGLSLIDLLAPRSGSLSFF